MKRIALGFAVLAAAGCSGADTPEAALSDDGPAEGFFTLSEVEPLGIRNAAMPVEGLVTGGQISEEQFDALAEMGYTNFISLRPTAEDGAGWEEAHVSGPDVSFNRIPIRGGDDLTRENVERLADIFDQARDEGSVLYCASSNRVGALLALKAFWLDGVDADDALELGRAAGMTRLEGRVTELISEGR